MGGLCDTGQGFDTGGAFYREGTAGVKTLRREYSTAEELREPRVLEQQYLAFQVR